MENQENNLPKIGDPAKFQIGRTSKAGLDDAVQVQIVSGGLHIRLEMTLEEFGRVITGEAHVPVRVARFNVSGDGK
jgi:hypothetical protein